ncbi:synaptonemal complex protein 3-like isoform X1 [Stylophora pistillata]|uniref:synaptonemal complex protein 3-like isoform X1 n=2 Tax=Stylophora pistillata TaxID=50429 RepID=UPI000C043A90|nr:synaptonemal complex protein 3-like isoform X1 [Stylophora pistillata]XP_022785004.1 synaptonemal complex protein 3-like isoform X1 [Stylophora pistillata]
MTRVEKPGKISVRRHSIESKETKFIQFIMPSNPKKGKASALKCTENLKEFYENEDEFKFSEAKPEQQQQKPEQVVKAKKRQAATPASEFQDSDPEDDEYDKGGSDLEMQGMLNSFGADITKTLAAKRKRIQTFTQASMKASSRKFEEVWRSQQHERSTHYDEFSRQVMNVLNQWETDLQKTREAEEKLENLYKQQQKLFQQQRIVQSQRLKRVRQLHEEHTKNMQQMQRSHESQQVSVQEQLRKEINILQKKILMDTQQHDFSSVRRSLQSMLAQV